MISTNKTLTRSYRIASTIVNIIFVHHVILKDL